MNMADQLGLENLENVSGGAGLSGISLSLDQIRTLVSESKVAGKSLDWCIDRVISIVKPRIGSLVNRETIRNIVTEVWNSFPGPNNGGSEGTW